MDFSFASSIVNPISSADDYDRLYEKSTQKKSNQKGF
jgi:hypothetical protein